MKNVENDARQTKQNKDIMSKQFKNLYENKILEEDLKDDSERLKQLSLKLSDIKDKNHSLFGQLKDLEAENVNLLDQIKSMKSSLEFQEASVKVEESDICDQTNKLKREITEGENKYEDRRKFKKNLEYIYADIVSTLRNMIRYMNIEVDSSN